MGALNKIRSNAENLKMNTERTSTPKTFGDTITDRKELRDFKHPKVTGHAQVIASPDESLLA